MESMAAASVHNSQPLGPQLAKPGTSSVSEDLVTLADPTFPAPNSCPGLLNRTYVANPAVSADSATAAAGNSFSLVSYNILAECHRIRYAAEYSYTPDEFLGQDYRHRLLMKELQYLNGDIVCLQEVSPAYFNNTLLPLMKRVRWPDEVSTKEEFDEGEATFYKTSCFDLVSSKGVSLTEVAHKEVETRGLSPEVGAAVNKYLDRADIVLLTQLRSKVSGKVVTIGNVHVVWDLLQSPDVKCVQVAYAIKEVVGMAGSDGAHIICGDFNSEWSSPVYQLVLDGYLSDSSIQTLQAVQRLELNDGADLSLVDHLELDIRHPALNLKSAYSTVMGKEPEVTSYTDHAWMLDYIFFDTKTLLPLGVLSLVDKDIIAATGGLPSKEFPSDHLSLKSVFAFL